MFERVPTPFPGFRESHIYWHGRTCFERVLVHGKRKDWYYQIGSGKVIFAGRDFGDACRLAVRVASATAS